MDEKCDVSVDDTNNKDNFNGIYYFESDHVALKGNADYSNVLKTLALLEAQRMKALKDLDTLHEKYQEALNDPIACVDKLQRQVDLGLPSPQTVASLPDIDWNKYTQNASFTSLASHKRMTRWKTQVEDGIKLDSGTTPASTSSGASGDVPGGTGVQLVRGRVKQKGKSDTFNILWSVEEQQRLEQLLVEFPEEEVEAQRFQKIADALGTRTRQQVASRIQKYFIKLAKAGLSIPGRTPTVYNLPKKNPHKYQKFQRFYQTPSTFLASHEPPVYMSDGDDSLDAQDVSRDAPAATAMSDVSDEEDIEQELRHLPEYSRLLKLKRLKRQKLDASQTTHHGYRCDACNATPIVGERWHCRDCPQERSVDFCQSCARSFLTGDHDPSHRLVQANKDTNKPHPTSSIIDTDYTQFQPDGYNYLDPNFMPAT